MAAKNKPNELYLYRVYDAPLKAVWDAWQDPEQVVQWWGPRGHTIKHHDKDLRTGGFWRYTMYGPNGEVWENVTKYLEVEMYKKLVYDHGGTLDQPPLFRVTVLFSEKDGKTHMDFTMSFSSPEVAQQTKKFIKKASGDSTWDRLGEFLEKEVQGKDRFLINRSFNAPIDVMYAMWTDPKHVAQWVPPTGFKMEFIEVSMKPGGKGFYKMFNDAGVTMYGKTEYLKFEKPNRIVYAQQFADKDGNVSRHPMAPTWPETMLTTVELSSEGDNQTRVTVTWEPYGKVTAEELATFINARAGMTGGWTGSFDKLEEYLDKQ